MPGVGGDTHILRPEGRLWILLEQRGEETVELLSKAGPFHLLDHLGREIDAIIAIELFGHFDGVVDAAARDESEKIVKPRLIILVPRAGGVFYTKKAGVSCGWSLFFFRLVEFFVHGLVKLD